MITPTKQAKSLRNKVSAKRAELNQLVANYGANNLRIFGSVARGNADQNSDIDFLVTPPQPFDYFERAGMIADIKGLMGGKIDLVFDDCLKEHIKQNIQNERMILI